MTKLYGSLEAGGTKFICAVGDDQFNVVEKVQFPTATPEEAIAQTIAFFQQFENLAALAIGTFGPADIDPESETYGYITSTPKPFWANTDLVGPITTALNVPVYFTTDVNSSAYGEALVREGVDSLIYYTIGTGIGAGAIQNGQFIGGISHAEAGHVYVAKHPDDADFEGICPFHGACLEGLAAGPSLEARTGIRGENIEQDSYVWDVQAYYIAQAAVAATLNFRPEVIVFGGGVMAQEHMLNRVRELFAKLMNNYVPVPELSEYIVTPAIAENGSATYGNFALAKGISA